MTTVNEIKLAVKRLASPKKATKSQRFFKTGVGEYSAGDIFLGVTMPELRQVAKNYQQLSILEIETLLQSPEHEYRMLALILWVTQFTVGDAKVRQQIFRCYLKNTKWINNWDLVDASAWQIVGNWLADRDEKLASLKKLAEAKSLWERRIAMVATFADIKHGRAESALIIAELLLKDQHDLIQKAVGWMLREVGKRCSPEILEKFLQTHYQDLARTTLRYAIEHFSPEKRVWYLNGMR